MATSVMLQKLGEGMVTSLWIFAVTLIFSLPLGLLISFGRMSKNKIISTIFKIYICTLEFNCVKALLGESLLPKFQDLLISCLKFSCLRIHITQAAGRRR